MWLTNSHVRRSSTCLLDRFPAVTLRHGAEKRNIFVELRAKWNLKSRIHLQLVAQWKKASKSNENTDLKTWRTADCACAGRFIRAMYAGLVLFRGSHHGGSNQQEKEG